MTQYQPEQRPCLCTEAERWRTIPSLPNYQASDHGQIRSIDRIIPYVDGRDRPLKGRVLRACRTRRGHLLVHVRPIPRTVHTLVLEAFVGPRPAGMECCHNDGDPTNNHLSNLRWDTQGNNNRDRRRHGADHQVRKTHCPAGHEYDHVNTRVYERPNGRVSRYCRACSLEHTRRRRAKAKCNAAPKGAAS